MTFPVRPTLLSFGAGSVGYVNYMLRGSVSDGVSTLTPRLIKVVLDAGGDARVSLPVTLALAANPYGVGIEVWEHVNNSFRSYICDIPIGSSEINIASDTVPKKAYASLIYGMQSVDNSDPWINQELAYSRLYSSHAHSTITPDVPYTTVVYDAAGHAKSGSHEDFATVAALDDAIAALSGFSSRLADDFHIDDTVVTLAHSIDVLTVGGAVVIKPYTVEAETRIIVSATDNDITLDRALKFDHAIGDRVLFTYYPDMVYDARIYGAKGDGIVNDTPSFEAAIVDLPDGGGEVTYGGGLFAINLIIDAHNVTLAGRGMNTLSTPNGLIPFNPSNPVLTTAGQGVLRHNIRLKNISINCQGTGAIGLYIAGGTYAAYFDDISSILATEYCVKIGDVAQDEIVSWVWLTNLVVQASGLSDTLVATISAAGGNVKYTTALFIENARISQVLEHSTDPGKTPSAALLVDNVPNMYIDNSYLQAKPGQGVRFLKSGNYLPRLYSSHFNIDAGPTNVGIELVAGFDEVSTYMSGTWHLNGKVKKSNGDVYPSTAGATLNSFAALNTPRLLQPYILAAMRFAGLDNPDFVGVPNVTAVGSHLQINANSGGEVQMRPGNSDTHMTRFSYPQGILLASGVKSALPPATIEGSIRYVTDYTVGGGLVFSEDSLWHQILQRDKDPAFTVPVGFGAVAALGSTLYSRAYFPWLPGDLGNTIYIGKNDVTNNMIPLRTQGYLNYGAWLESFTLPGAIIKSHQNVAAHAMRHDVSANAISPTFRIERRMDGGVPTDGIGAAWYMTASTYNSGVEHVGDDVALIQALHPVANKAAFTSRLYYYMSDFGGYRLGMTLEADGTQARVGFYSAPPVARQTAPANADGTLAGATTAVNAMIAAMKAIGIYFNPGLGSPLIADLDPITPDQTALPAGEDLLEGPYTPVDIPVEGAWVDDGSDDQYGTVPQGAVLIPPLPTTTL